MEPGFLSMIPVEKGMNWIEKLFQQLKRMREKRKAELNNIQEVLSIDPLILAKYYIEPYCQDVNPTDYLDEYQDTEKGPIKRRIDLFLQMERISEPGSNVMFVLADAGMGKTALLAMIKLLHLTLSWPKIKKCELLKLGYDSIKRIKEIKTAGKHYCFWML
jgi:hypothetical protein